MEIINWVLFETNNFVVVGEAEHSQCELQNDQYSQTEHVLQSTSENRQN